MRKSSYLALFIIGASLMLLAPAITTGQGKGKGKGNFGGGGGDPATLFDRLAKGQNTISISQTNIFRTQLQQFAQENGITGDTITRQQFAAFQESLTNKIAPRQPGGTAPGAGEVTPFGGGKGKGKGGGGGFDPSAFGGGGMPFGNMQFGGGKGPKGGGGIPQGVALTAEAISDLADQEFKRYDLNGDQKLNKDEMPTKLLAVLATWDKNGDTFIDREEYRAYFAARINEAGNLNQAVTNIIIEDDEERKVIVYKAGNLPRNIPSWFRDLDTNNDGQVEMCEWRAGKKPLDEFRNWDLNDDGFIIPEEALRCQEILLKNSRGGDGTSLAGGVGSGERPAFVPGGMGEGKGWGGGGKKDKKGYGSGDTGDIPFGGFMKKNKKGGGGNGN